MDDPILWNIQRILWTKKKLHTKKYFDEINKQYKEFCELKLKFIYEVFYNKQPKII